jgi:hypothetical protein
VLPAYLSAQITIPENKPTLSDKLVILEYPLIGKTFRFYPGNHITLSTLKDTNKISGNIISILDSSFIMDNGLEVNLHDVRAVYTDRAGVFIVSSVLMLFGVMYFSVDVINNVINNDHPTIGSRVALISASSEAVGGLLWLFHKRKCRIRKDKWHLKIIEQIHVKKQ